MDQPLSAHVVGEPAKDTLVMLPGPSCLLCRLTGTPSRCHTCILGLQRPGHLGHCLPQACTAATVGKAVSGHGTAGDLLLWSRMPDTAAIRST